MPSPDPLHDYRTLTEGSGYSATANVTALTPGDVAWFRSVGLTSEWFEPRRLGSGPVTCAMCRVTFVGDECSSCGIRRRGRA